MVGDFKNGGRELRPQGDAEQVRVHDFVIPELGRVTPYGVYDVGKNRGWVSVGVDHDTATFAVESIRRWWCSMGKPIYRQAQRLLITADSGGSNGSRVRLWKLELQKLADETRLHISVCHLPPDTSKWNKIEHRLFSFISQNWRGKPLVSHEVIVNLISATTTQTGLKVRAKLDANSYPPRAKVSKKQIAEINIRPDSFHGEWNSLVLQKAESFQVPAIIADVGPEATKRFFEFFTVPIRNKNTRMAYYQAIGQFLDWCQRAGFRGLEDIEPITVAAYIEQHPGSPATIKQHMSAIRMLFSWLTEKGILAMNSAREVKTEKFSRREGKTPAFHTEQVQKVLDKIDTSNEVGLRDRALLGT